MDLRLTVGAKRTDPAGSAEALCGARQVNKGGGARPNAVNMMVPNKAGTTPIQTAKFTRCRAPQRAVHVCRKIISQKYRFLSIFCRRDLCRRWNHQPDYSHVRVAASRLLSAAAAIAARPIVRPSAPDKPDPPRCVKRAGATRRAGRDGSNTPNVRAATAHSRRS